MTFTDDNSSPCGTIEFIDLPIEDEIFTAAFLSTNQVWSIKCIRNNNYNEFKSCSFSMISFSIGYTDSTTKQRYRDLKIRVFGLGRAPRLFEVRYFIDPKTAILDVPMSVEDAENLYDRF